MRWFLNAGLTASTPVSERLRIFLLNRLILICFFINISIFLIDMALGIYINAIANLCLLSIYVPLYYLHHRQHYLLVRNVFTIILNAFIVGISIATYHQGRWTETENILMASIAGIVFMYNKWDRFAAISLVTIFLFGLKLYKFQYFGLAVDENFLLTLINSAITIVAIYFFMGAFQKEFSLAIENTVFLNADLNKQKQELSESERKLAELNKTKNKLFSIVAHDLKKPLNLLHGLVSMGDYQDFTEEERRFQNERLKKNLNAVDHMMDNILVWAKSQMEGYKIIKDNYKLSLIVEEILILYGETIKNKGLKIEMDLRENTEVYVDQNLLKIAIRNIINNAMKYTNQKGRIRIFDRQSEEIAYLYVVDDGVGVDKEIRRKIASGDPMISEFGTDGEPGTGLGLALSMEMLRLIDSNFSIDCPAQGGTMVKISIPLAPVPEKLIRSQS